MLPHRGLSSRTADPELFEPWALEQHDVVERRLRKNAVQLLEPVLQERDGQDRERRAALTDTGVALVVLLRAEVLTQGDQRHERLAQAHVVREDRPLDARRGLPVGIEGAVHETGHPLDALTLVRIRVHAQVVVGDGAPRLSGPRCTALLLGEVSGIGNDHPDPNGVALLLIRTGEGAGQVRTELFELGPRCFQHLTHPAAVGDIDEPVVERDDVTAGLPGLVDLRLDLGVLRQGTRLRGERLRARYPVPGEPGDAALAGLGESHRRDPADSRDTEPESELDIDQIGVEEVAGRLDEVVDLVRGDVGVLPDLADGRALVLVQEHQVVLDAQHAAVGGVRVQVVPSAGSLVRVHTDAEVRLDVEAAVRPLLDDQAHPVGPDHPGLGELSQIDVQRWGFALGPVLSGPVERLPQLGEQPHVARFGALPHRKCGVRLDGADGVEHRWCQAVTTRTHVDERARPADRLRVLALHHLQVDREVFAGGHTTDLPGDRPREHLWDPEEGGLIGVEVRDDVVGYHVAVGDRQGHALLGQCFQCKQLQSSSHRTGAGAERGQIVRRRGEGDHAVARRDGEATVLRLGRRAASPQQVA